MKIILEYNGQTNNATVEDENWVGNAREAAYAWATFRGGGTVTARESNGEEGNPRIVSVTVEYHDE